MRASHASHLKASCACVARGLREHGEDVELRRGALGLAGGAQREVHQQRGAVLDRVERQVVHLAERGREPAHDVGLDHGVLRRAAERELLQRAERVLPSDGVGLLEPEHRAELRHQLRLSQ
eukprot:1242930-Pleurochrysis_carterae.AAC.5